MGGAILIIQWLKPHLAFSEQDICTTRTVQCDTCFECSAAHLHVDSRRQCSGPRAAYGNAKHFLHGFSKHWIFQESNSDTNWGKTVLCIVQTLPGDFCCFRKCIAYSYARSQMPIFVTAIFMIRKQALTASLGLLIVPNNYFYNVHYLLYILINLLIYVFLCLYRLCYTLLSFLFFVTTQKHFQVWLYSQPDIPI